MLLKGDISVVLELKDVDWVAQPIGFSFRNFFFGVVIFYKSNAAQHTLAPDVCLGCGAIYSHHEEAGCAQCGTPRGVAPAGKA